MRDHPALGAVNRLGPEDLEALVHAAGEKLDMAALLDWPPGVAAWWALLGTVAGTARRGLGFADLDPHGQAMVIAQMEAARDEAARARRPALADTLNDLLGALVDAREAGR